MGSPPVLARRRCQLFSDISRPGFGYPKFAATADCLTYSSRLIDSEFVNS